MILYIILGINYYVLSSLLFIKLLEDENSFALSKYEIIIELIPIVRFIYYIYVKLI